MERKASLRDLKSFGDVAAEQDAVLRYFLATEAVTRIETGNEYVVLGRKGSGKTALVRHFAEGKTSTLSRAINLGHYPWKVHALRKDQGAAEIEAYVASWYYLIAVQIASTVLDKMIRGHTLAAAKSLHNFLLENYGRATVSLDEILRPKQLRLSSLSFEPEVFGVKIGSVGLERGGEHGDFGIELKSLSDLMIKACIELAYENSFKSIIIHFDELDRGLSSIDQTRADMLTGLIWASRAISEYKTAYDITIKSVVYLRTDIWDELRFSDKNKIAQGRSITLEWSAVSLLELINLRLVNLLGSDANWEAITTNRQMRGSQTKWNHIIARTFKRPRDTISFLNAILDEVKRRKDEKDMIDNEDIAKARVRYSRYLKQELDDEIVPHWADWEIALQACSAIRTITFYRHQFAEQYDKRFKSDSVINADRALELLYRFSVVGYEKRSGYGGSSFVFNYSDPEAGWDNSASRFKVHLGLKEFAKLTEERQPAINIDWDEVDLDLGDLDAEEEATE